MSKSVFRATLASAAIALSSFGFMGGALSSALAQDSVMVGGAPMLPSKNIIENAVNSKDHTTLVAAVKQAGLVETLSGKGPFTVFAPTNAAFEALPKGTVDSLMKPESKDKLTKILTAHVVAGKHSGKEIMQKAMDMKDGYTMKTASGDTLTAKMDGKTLWIVDENGGKARVTIPDVNQSNGVIHVVDKILLPK